jgi:hypothetical protein
MALVASFKDRVGAGRSAQHSAFGKMTACKGKIAQPAVRCNMRLPAFMHGGYLRCASRIDAKLSGIRQGKMQYLYRSSSKVRGSRRR